MFLHVRALPCINIFTRVFIWANLLGFITRRAQPTNFALWRNHGSQPCREKNESDNKTWRGGEMTIVRAREDFHSFRTVLCILAYMWPKSSLQQGKNRKKFLWSYDHVWIIVCIRILYPYTLANTLCITSSCTFKKWNNSILQTCMYVWCTSRMYVICIFILRVVQEY